VANLVDTNILVYRWDPRFPAKREVARALLKKGLAERSVILPHQVIVEFISAVTRPRPDLGGQPLLTWPQARRRAENLITEFPIVYPDENVLATAIESPSGYQLSWYDAHLLAYAQVYGMDELFSEDFEHGRHYGGVRAVDPFLSAADSIHELPPLYDTAEA
jgi:predicted nucleic acid-binding protein